MRHCNLFRLNYGIEGARWTQYQGFFARRMAVPIQAPRATLAAPPASWPWASGLKVSATDAVGYYFQN
jgi:hypothetical protein